MRISSAESKYIIDGIKANFRQDGRTCDTYREFSIDTDVVSNTNGSARVQLGGTHVLCGIKAMTGEPDASGNGRIEFYVECTAGAKAEFAHRGGESLGIDMTNMLKKMAQNESAINVEGLRIIPGTVWVLRVDVLVLHCMGGNLYDCAALAVRTALDSTKLPKIDVVTDAETNEPIDFDVSSDPHAVQSVGGIEQFPLLVTISEVDSTCIIDCTEQEECCVGGRLVVALNRSGNLCAINQDRSGGFSPAALIDMLRMARQTGTSLFQKLDVTMASGKGGLAGSD